MPDAALSPTDSRPRNSYGQFATGAETTPDDMNRAYGIRQRVLNLFRRRKPLVTPTSDATMPTPVDKPSNALAARVRRSVIQLEKYDLGSLPEVYSSCCATPEKPSEPQKRYPRLCIDGDHAIPLPKSGQAIIDYRVRSVESHEDADGNERHSMGLEIQSIEPVGSASEDETAEDEIDDEDSDESADESLSARVDRVIELAFGDRFFANATNPGSAAARVFIRTRIANVLKQGRAAARAMYPRATQRAINAVAQSQSGNISHIAGQAAAPTVAQEQRIVDAFQRHAGMGRKAVGFASASEALARVVELARVEASGGWLKIRRDDGTEARVPLRGAGNFLKRNAVNIGAATVGVGVPVAGALLLRKPINRAVANVRARLGK